MSQAKPRLAFVSPLFLFPNDAGGKIRTTNVLRGLKGGAFDITLATVASPEQARAWAREIGGVCDEFIAWRPKPAVPRWRRAADLFNPLPVNIVNDRTDAGMAAVRQLAARTDIDLIVFDFVHSAVLRPAFMACPTACFTHNVEAEIFARHASQATNPLWRRLWSSQHAKMRRYEGEVLKHFDTVIAVSDRDVAAFRTEYGIREVHAIPTGVDLDFFYFRDPPIVSDANPPTVVFTGSMDWVANIDGVQFFLKEIWPLVLAASPVARFVIVGRNPPAALQALAKSLGNVSFTGFVDDVRPYVHAAHAFVIPLLVGGGTRIKAFEAMAMGCPVVSTSIGIEGLEAQEGRDYLRRDSAEALAQGIVDLFRDPDLRRTIACNARELVEQRFGHRVASRAFEQICLDTLAAYCPGR